MAPEQIAAYRMALLVKSLVSQQRMMAGYDPSMCRAGEGPGMSRGESSSCPPNIRCAPRARLLPLPEVSECAEWTEWPAELWRPSDLCEELRSIASPLPGRMGPNSPECRVLCPQLALSSKRTLLAREAAPRLAGSSSGSRCNDAMVWFWSSRSKGPCGGRWIGPGQGKVSSRCDLGVSYPPKGPTVERSQCWGVPLRAVGKGEHQTDFTAASSCWRLSRRNSLSAWLLGGAGAGGGAGGAGGSAARGAGGRG